MSERQSHQRKDPRSDRPGIFVSGLEMDQLMVMVSAFEAGPPGLVATREPDPAAARSLAGMATVTCVASTMVVVR